MNEAASDTNLIWVDVSHVVDVFQLGGPDVSQDHGRGEVQVVVAEYDVEVDLQIASLADPKHALPA